MAKGPLDKSFVYKGLRKELAARYGDAAAASIWEHAHSELAGLIAQNPDTTKNDLTFVFPAVALYRAIEGHAPGEALEVERAYGTKTGLRMRDILRRLTSLPGIPALVWKKMPAIARRMSDGYETEDMVVTDHLCSLHVVGCPMRDSAARLDCPEAAQLICCMDKEYMTGIRGVRYTRTKSLAEGDEYCDYLLEDSRGAGRG